jgi:hypothetical protein
MYREIIEAAASNDIDWVCSLIVIHFRVACWLFVLEKYIFCMGFV